MTTLAANTTQTLDHGATGLRQTIAARFDRTTTAWSRYREYRRAIRELEACSDRTLRDLGIYRGDIRRLVYEANYG